MAFAGRTGITMTTTLRDDALLRAMFAEELGAVIQIAADDHPAVEAVMRAHDLLPYVSVIGAPNATRTIEIRDGATLLYHAPLAALQQQWADVSYHMQALRDTNSELRDLIQKYQPSSGKRGSPGNTSTTSLPAATS